MDALKAKKDLYVIWTVSYITETDCFRMSKSSWSGCIKKTSRSCSLRIRANARRVSFSRSLREWDFMLTRVIFIPVPSQRQNLSAVKPGCSAYVIGAPGLVNALYDQGITMNSIDPDYVIVGETSSYNYETVVHASNLVRNGAKLIGTNTDLTGPVEDGIVPACRALISPIEMATGKKAYFVGKPNPLMMRTGLKMLGVHSAEAAMIGDRMDTDVIAGIETGLDTVLVLSGVTNLEDVNLYPYRPTYIFNGVGDVFSEI